MAHELSKYTFDALRKYNDCGFFAFNMFTYVCENWFMDVELWTFIH